ncbi:MAG: J domain-containing protein [bacterium]
MQPYSDHYLALGVGSTASHDEIKKAHRALIRELHPDRGGQSLSAAQVNIARDILLDPVTRLEYEATRVARAQSAAERVHRRRPAAPPRTNPSSTRTVN